MLADSSEKTDVLGAGEFLPSTEDGDMEVEVKTIKRILFVLLRLVKIKPQILKKKKPMKMMMHLNIRMVL